MSVGRCRGSLALVVVVLLVGIEAAADEVSVTIPVVLRERADETAPVVTRLPEGAVVTLVGRVADGSWLQVKSGAKKGWAEKVFFKLDGAAPPASTASPAPAAGATTGDERSLVAPRKQPAPTKEAPLAPSRPHPDGWVTKSTWAPRHGLDAVVLAPCDVHARTDEESRVVARLERGQTVRLGRMSIDESWGLVRGDGADLGWVSMAAVRVRGGVPDERGVEAAPSEPTTAAAATSPGLGLVARPSLPDRRNALVLGADIGVAVIARRYVSNGTSPLAAYELSATAVTSGVAGSYGRRLGSRGVIGVDLSYAYASGARVRVTTADGTTPTLRLQTHDAEGGLRIGLHSGAAGGVDVWLRAGALLTVTVFDPDATVRLQSDRLIAPTAGLGLTAPHLAAIGNHWLGVDLFARAVLFGQTSENIDEGHDRGTFGGRLGGDLSFELWRTPARGQLVVTAGYSYTVTVARFTGPSARDATASEATLGSAQHLAALAIGYAY